MREIFLSLCFLFASQICAITHSISDLQVIEKELEALDGEVLVLFDVDRTLIVPDDAILRPPTDMIIDSFRVSTGLMGSIGVPLGNVTSQLFANVYLLSHANQHTIFQAIKNAYWVRSGKFNPTGKAAPQK